MYRHLKAGPVPVRLFYWIRTPDDALFVDELAADPDVRMIVSGDIPQQGDFISEILEGVPQDAELYCCGPQRMLLDYERATASRPRHLVHSERFSGTEAEVLAESFSVKLAKQGISIEVQPGQSILQACLDAGVDVSYSCEEGICGACEVAIITGEVSHKDSFRSPEEHESLRTMMICSSVPTSRELVLDI